jgi:2-polyprenyl-6-methoxyphenol hydroxylase-like FAD-dependent oxidoreductase
MRFGQAPTEVFRQLVPDQDPPITNDYIMWAMLFPKEDLPSAVEDLDCYALHRIAINAVRPYHSVLRRFIEVADQSYTVGVVIYAATKPTNWVVSRATLIGDAVHVMPPTGAHGGNTALRDSATLAGELKTVITGHQSLLEAVGRYQAKMLDYAFREVTQSVAMLKRTNMKNSAARFLMLRAVPRLRSLLGTRLVPE